MKLSVPQALKSMSSVKPSIGFLHLLLPGWFLFCCTETVHGETLPFPAFRAAVPILLDLYPAALPSLCLASLRSPLFLYAFPAVARKDATVGYSYNNKSIVAFEVWIWTWVATFFLNFFLSKVRSWELAYSRFFEKWSFYCGTSGKFKKWLLKHWKKDSLWVKVFY